MKFDRIGNMAWEDVQGCPAWLDNLYAELRLWEGTPYQSGQSCCSVAADCIGSIFGVVDKLERNGGPRWQQLPSDTALHDRASAVNTMRTLIRRYPTAIKLEAFSGLLYVQPGDIVVMGPTNGAPGHVAIVGPEQDTLWHCTEGAGFHQTGWFLARSLSIVSVYRIMNRKNWQ